MKKMISHGYETIGSSLEASNHRGFFMAWGTGFDLPIYFHFPHGSWLFWGHQNRNPNAVAGYFNLNQILPISGAIIDPP
jgi:hypothetical protein